MTPASINLVAYKGITFAVVLTLKNENGTPVPLTGYTVFADVRRAPNSSAVLFSLSPTLSNAAGGEVSIDLSDETTAGLPTGTFHWDLVLQNAGGQRIGPFVAGSFQVSNLSTRPA